MKRILALAVLASLTASCTAKKEARFAVTPDYNAIFSTRPQTTTHALFLIKLKNPPLLSQLEVTDGKKQVNAELAESIVREQESLLTDLQKLSSEIQPVYRYRMVLNAVAVVAPTALQSKIKALTNVVAVDNSASFARPIEIDRKAVARAANNVSESLKDKLTEKNSAKFIGVDAAYARGLRGQNLRVGIIDSGIDYTHAMFGGAATEDAFKAIDPSKTAPGFPNAKVVGGVDLVGTVYDAASADFMKRIPIPDANPIDEGGHGTHVAGTVAGRGDGVNTYDGVAPDALLYAIKVFGADGSTSDAIVISALEYAADPNTDGEISDQLDVVNLSLGGGYGDSHLLYAEAIRNLSTGGTSVVASAGNSGDSSYIVGAPGVSPEAFSIAASIDDMDHNWKFRAVRFVTPEQPELLAEAIEGTLTKPIEEAGAVSGALIYVGLADQDFPDELKSQISGKVALIDRGGVPFADKVRRAAEAGSIGIVMANNQDGDPIAMGGEGEFPIPGIMVTKALGVKLKVAMSQGEVRVDFQTSAKIEKPELIDTITSFSSKGPRSMDALIKPEIAAPGSQVISAEMGGGTKGVAMSGTSMAAPHMAGVMTLLKQAFPSLTPSELKSVAMGSAKPLLTRDQKGYPISRQGAGRVQIAQALEAVVVSQPSALSLGEITVESQKRMSRSIQLKNISQAALNLSLGFEGHSAIKLIGAPTVTLNVGESKTLAVSFQLDIAGLPETSLELDGLVKIMSQGQEVSHVPVLAVANKVSQVKAERLIVRSTSAADSQGADVELTLANRGMNAGQAYPFNLIARDARKVDPTEDPDRSRACDLAESGYRVINRNGERILQVAVKLYEPVTTWDSCEVSVLIDANGDGEADQELVGVKQDHLAGLTEKKFASLLLDAKKARELRKKFEEDTRAGKPEITEDYTSTLLALQPMLAFEHSTVAIVEAPLKALQGRSTGELAVRIATSYQETTAIEPDDFLSSDPKKWTVLSTSEFGAGYIGLPEKVELSGSQSLNLSFTKGAGNEKLWLVYPTNRPVIGGLSRDQQSQTVKPIFEVGSSVVAGGN